MHRIVLVDDHIVIRQALADLICSFGDYEVLYQADHGKAFIEQLPFKDLPDLVLLDISMPVMDGYQTSAWLKEFYPGIKVLVLTMVENEPAILRMLKNGVRGFILKAIDPQELHTAISSVLERGFYYTETVSNQFINSVFSEQDHELQRIASSFSDKEMLFLKLACSELSYKAIAETMHVSPRTIDSYRDNLFERLKVKTRVGLVIYAFKSGIVTL